MRKQSGGSDDELRWKLFHTRPDWQGPTIGAVKSEWNRAVTAAFAAALWLDHRRQTDHTLRLGAYSYIVACYTGRCRNYKHGDLHGPTLMNQERARRRDEQHQRWQQAKQDAYTRELPDPPLVLLEMGSPPVTARTEADDLRRVKEALEKGDSPAWLVDLARRRLVL